MTTGYKTLTRAESYCSLNSSSSSHVDTALEPPSRDDATSRPPPQRPLIKKKSSYYFRCRYCKDTFTSRQHGSEGLCDKAPNYARENVDRLCIVKGYRGCWYHLTKDELPHDQENEDIIDVLRFEFPHRMAISLWVKFILISIFCFPCICLWIPFALWERHTRFVFGPRHSIRRKRIIIDNTTKNNQRTSIQQNSLKEDQPSQQTDHTTTEVQELTANSAPVPTNDVQITIEPEPSIPPPPPDVPPPTEEDEEGPTNEVEGRHTEDEDIEEDTGVKVAVGLDMFD